MKKLKKNQGITLIALVITIIVLLILAGISIQGLTGSGIFEKAKQAIEKSKYANALEKVKLAVTASYDESGNINNEFLKDNLNAIEGKEGELVEDENDITVKVDGYLFQVSKSTGEVIKKDIEIADGEVDNSREIDEEEYNSLKEKVGIMSNTIDMLKNDTYTKTEIDNKFLNINGMIMTQLGNSVTGTNTITFDSTGYKMIYIQTSYVGDLNQPFLFTSIMSVSDLTNTSTQIFGGSPDASYGSSSSSMSNRFFSTWNVTKNSVSLYKTACGSEVGKYSSVATTKVYGIK